MKRAIFGLVAVGLACAVGIGVGFFVWGIGSGIASGDSMPGREQIRQLMGDYAADQYDKIVQYNRRSEGLLRVGDAAPDLTLAGLDGTPHPISAYFKEKPLVLSFGSYT